MIWNSLQPKDKTFVIGILSKGITNCIGCPKEHSLVPLLVLCLTCCVVSSYEVLFGTFYGTKERFLGTQDIVCEMISLNCFRTLAGLDLKQKKCLSCH